MPNLNNAQQATLDDLRDKGALGFEYAGYNDPVNDRCNCDSAYTWYEVARSKDGQLISRVAISTQLAYDGMVGRGLEALGKKLYEETQAEHPDGIVLCDWFVPVHIIAEDYFQQPDILAAVMAALKPKESKPSAVTGLPHTLRSIRR